MMRRDNTILHRGGERHMRTTLLGRALALLIALPGVATAQADQIPALAPQCDAGATPKLDTATVTVGLWPAERWKDNKYGDKQQLRMRYYADAIRQYFVAPPSLGELPLLGEETAGKPNDEGMRSVIAAGLVLVVEPGGRTKTVAWGKRPLSDQLAAALAAAVTAADTAGAFDGIPRESRVNDTLLLTVGSRRGDLPAGGVPLLRARVEGYVVDRPPMTLKMATPEYPENARRNFAGNKGVLSVIIGSGGRAYMPSFHLTRTDFADFELPMRVAVAESSFEAAHSGGCRVPQLVQQPFEFHPRSRAP
jgi:hypothetical protein